jgi:hypothetical protein
MGEVLFFPNIMLEQAPVDSAQAAPEPPETPLASGELDPASTTPPTTLETAEPASSDIIPSTIQEEVPALQGLKARLAAKVPGLKVAAYNAAYMLSGARVNSPSEEKLQQFRNASRSRRFALAASMQPVLTGLLLARFGGTLHGVAEHAALPLHIEHATLMDDAVRTVDTHSSAAQHALAATFGNEHAQSNDPISVSKLSINDHNREEISIADNGGHIDMLLPSDYRARTGTDLPALVLRDGAIEDRIPADVFSSVANGNDALSPADLSTLSRDLVREMLYVKRHDGSFYEIARESGPIPTANINNWNYLKDVGDVLGLALAATGITWFVRWRRSLRPGAHGNAHGGGHGHGRGHDHDKPSYGGRSHHH